MHLSTNARLISPGPPPCPCSEREYLVKYVGRSHIHNEWVPESTLMQIAKRKAINFKRRYGDAPVSLMEEQWQVGLPPPSATGAPLLCGLWRVLLKGSWVWRSVRSTVPQRLQLPQAGLNF